jgi:hypothetical protein
MTLLSLRRNLISLVGRNGSGRYGRLRLTIGKTAIGSLNSSLEEWAIRSCVGDSPSGITSGSLSWASSSSSARLPLTRETCKDWRAKLNGYGVPLRMPGRSPFYSSTTELTLTGSVRGRMSSLTTPSCRLRGVSGLHGVSKASLRTGWILYSDGRSVPTISF